MFFLEGKGSGGQYSFLLLLLLLLRLKLVETSPGRLVEFQPNM